MYLLFLDESGNSPQDRHFVLAGLAVFEGELFRLRAGFDALLRDVFPDEPEKFFHASDLYKEMKAAGRRADYFRLMDHMASLLLEHNYASGDPARPGVVLFGQVIERAALSQGKGSYEEAFEGILGRFHHFLRDLKEQGNAQKGLIVIASSKRQDHEGLRKAFAVFREHGTRLGYISNVPLVPLFTAARATRFLQLADFVAYALLRAYERDDWKYLRPIMPAFYQRGGIYEGLYHLNTQYAACPCPACVSRRGRGALSEPQSTPRPPAP